MKRREFITLLGGSSASVVWSLPLGAQRGAARLPRIGYLTLSPISDKPSPERMAFLQGLRELGYIEGKTIQIQYSSAESYPELLPQAAEALVEQGVDLIAATGVVPALAAKQATQIIPVVFTYVSDPVGNGLVASLVDRRATSPGSLRCSRNSLARRSSS